MNKLHLNQTGGFPLTTDILNAMQNAYAVFNSLGSLAGNYTIISGCEQTGNNIADGVVYINGELLPFKGGAKISKVRIVETTESKQFEDGQTKEVLFKRFAQFGTGVNAIDWSKFEPVNPLTQIMKRVKALEDRPYFEPGMILMWNRPASEIPLGFEPYTEMAGRTPIGRDSNYVYTTNEDVENYNLDKLGAVGGVREHALTEPEMPKHSHTKNNVFKYFATFFKNLNNNSSHAGNVTDSHDDNDKEYALSINDTSYTKSDAEIQEVGGNKAHTNMSPYRIVEFIKYVGI